MNTQEIACPTCGKEIPFSGAPQYVSCGECGAEFIVTVEA